MRWKAFFYNNKMNLNKHKKYGLSMKKSPPIIYELRGFEYEHISLIKDFKFKSTRNKFQNQLMSDVQKINTYNDIPAATDKTNNMHKTSY